MACLAGERILDGVPDLTRSNWEIHAYVGMVCVAFAR